MPEDKSSTNDAEQQSNQEGQQKSEPELYRKAEGELIDRNKGYARRTYAPSGSVEPGTIGNTPGPPATPDAG